MITEKKKVKYTCTSCNEDTHVWHEAYYEEGVKLLRAEKSYITWCKKSNVYVITNNRG